MLPPRERWTRVVVRLMAAQGSRWVSADEGASGSGRATRAACGDAVWLLHAQLAERTTGNGLRMGFTRCSNGLGCEKQMGEGEGTQPPAAGGCVQRGEVCARPRRGKGASRMAWRISRG